MSAPLALNAEGEEADAKALLALVFNHAAVVANLTQLLDDPPVDAAQLPTTTLEAVEQARSVLLTMGDALGIETPPQSAIDAAMAEMQVGAEHALFLPFWSAMLLSSGSALAEAVLSNMAFNGLYNHVAGPHYYAHVYATGFAALQSLASALGCPRPEPARTS